MIEWLLRQIEIVVPDVGPIIPTINTLELSFIMEWQEQ
jgi:hypothetical protein